MSRGEITDWGSDPALDVTTKNEADRKKLGEILAGTGVRFTIALANPNAVEPDTERNVYTLINPPPAIQALVEGSGLGVRKALPSQRTATDHARETHPRALVRGLDMSAPNIRTALANLQANGQVGVPEVTDEGVVLNISREAAEQLSNWGLSVEWK